MYFVSKTLGIKLVFVNYKTVTPKKGVVPVLHTECFLIELNLARFVTGFPNIVNRCIELYSVGGALIFFYSTQREAWITGCVASWFKWVEWRNIQAKFVYKPEA